MVQTHRQTEGLAHQVFTGSTWHTRLLPSRHKFVYPYRYWGINISALAAGISLPEVTLLDPKHTRLRRRWIRKLPLFSTQHKALQQFCADDYLPDYSSTQHTASGRAGTQASSASHRSPQGHLEPFQALAQRLRDAFTTYTGSSPTGEILGMLVCRNLGFYFSPVNFYIGFDQAQVPSHLLAEVSNTPWDERHYYGLLLAGEDTERCHNKAFHVSPFNPIDQRYRWRVTIKRRDEHALATDQRTDQRDHSNKPLSKHTAERHYDHLDTAGLDIRIAIDISDARGEVLRTGVKMSGAPMTPASIRQTLRDNPVMNLTSLSRIYWQALKLYAIKKVPYVNYGETLADSHQGSVNSSTDARPHTTQKNIVDNDDIAKR